MKRVLAMLLVFLMLLTTSAMAAGMGVQIIGIVIDVPEGDADMIKTAREICADTGVKYTNITDNDSVEALLGSVEAIPTTFILDSEGKTVCTPIVGADVPSYKDAVEEYLK